jgi:LytS/YehU family sensor histidine kinase
MESKLQALQARVEPQFLFNTLAQVKALYAREHALAERTLDDLVAFLRAAMPGMRDTASTLAREAELVRAYLGIVSLRVGERFRFTIELPADAAERRFPPMLMLPLVDCALPEDTCTAFPDALAIEAAVRDDRVRLSIVATGDGLAWNQDGADLAFIRERLAALHGDAASLSLGAEPAGGTRAVLEMPCTRAA